ncbi:Bacteroides conjugative transposon TraK protein [Cnuella takakiae]|uniref:Bacteroides conjugative transposon TraK protein n=1 Tax=Cnuella takakiae TaxID=1302690 RepID=A0A1M4SDH5_9BACT|nr:conjugative transposon protein TraK [Cnuella takakiae]OLY94466.1 conjugative transposon protein TraK [Cnuella takakiae]SHE30067.1 Bacteroides conjugative transposon TraK protein [Cnuella takakiae]
MFRKSRNLETAFQQVRLFALVTIVGSLSFAAFVTYRSYQLAAQTESKVYVLAAGKAMEAFASTKRDNLLVEAKDHIRTFHEYFFTLDPDDDAIKATITKALYLADGSAKSLYESLKENNYYTGIISGNVSQKVRIDSVWVNLDEQPFRFRCQGVQEIIRPTAVITRSLATEGMLRLVARSDHNPHGFLIERWRTLENKDLKTESR